MPQAKMLEVKRLIFVTADRCREQLEALTRLLVSAFPGSTVYQHTDLCRVPHDVLHNRVDAVFLVAEPDRADGLELVQGLGRQKKDLPVFVISQTEALRSEAERAGAKDYLVRPVTGQQLRQALAGMKEHT